MVQDTIRRAIATIDRLEGIIDEKNEMIEALEETVDLYSQVVEAYKMRVDLLTKLLAEATT